MSQLPLFEPAPWTITDITRYIRELIETDSVLQDIWVQGEISNFSRPSSGHLYFTLKDSSASLRCVMWRNAAMRLRVGLRDGDAVEVHGSLSVYEAGGQYQLYADQIRPVGEGELYQEFLRLKDRLEAEGLFDIERKRPVTRWPRRIGIVTSPTGAALRDMLNTLRRRYPLVEVVLSPTPVQGIDAPPKIIQALQELNRVASPDTILVARGGGSIEDLWAFNDEGVARAIAASPAPVITGVGHETDFTIADFASDLRAPTPTAAAELAVPNRDDLQAALVEFNLRIARAAQSAVKNAAYEVDALQARLLLHSPRTRIRTDRQRLDDDWGRLGRAMLHRAQIKQERLNSLQGRLRNLNPQSILGRGYAIVTRQNGSLLRSVKQAVAGDPLWVQVSDGQFVVRVSSSSEESVET